MLKCSTGGAAAVASLPDGHKLKCCWTGAALPDVLVQGHLVVIRRVIRRCLGGPALPCLAAFLEHAEELGHVDRQPQGCLVDRVGTVWRANFSRRVNFQEKSSTK